MNFYQYNNKKEEEKKTASNERGDSAFPSENKVESDVQFDRFKRTIKRENGN